VLRRTLLALFLALLPACGTTSRAISDFDSAALPDALAELQREEGHWAEWNPRERAHYALYRGLVHLGLGEANPAHRWLGYAKQVQRRSPDLLEPDEHGRLDSAWNALGFMPGQWGPEE
jgi:hypothetical protein